MAEQKKELAGPSSAEDYFVRKTNGRLGLTIYAHNDDGVIRAEVCVAGDRVLDNFGLFEMEKGVARKRFNEFITKMQFTKSQSFSVNSIQI